MNPFLSDRSHIYFMYVEYLSMYLECLLMYLEYLSFIITFGIFLYIEVTTRVLATSDGSELSLLHLPVHLAL